MQDKRDHHIRALRDVPSDRSPGLTRGELKAWDRMLRTTPEGVPTVEREPLTLSDMPEHQQTLWLTLMEFEESDPPPWVLVGGQMAALHLAEHGHTAHRPTDDGDVVVGVWTRRDALRSTSIFPTSNGFTEHTTTDGYGYRFVRGKTAIEVMIPKVSIARTTIQQRDRDGQSYPPTAETRHSLAPSGYRFVVAFRDPRAVISQTRPNDRRVVRAALRRLPSDHRLWRAAEDPATTRSFLDRVAESPN